MADQKIDIIIETLLKNEKFKKAMKQNQKAAKGATTAQKKQGFSLSKLSAGYAAFAAVITGVVAIALKKVINSAKEFEEANAKFGVVFKNNSREANAMRKELVRSYGLSTNAATDMLASIQDFLIPMGLARKEATGLSGNIAVLARDLGSFNDQPTEDVLVAIKSALSGISMPMKRFGVDVSEAGLQQQLMNEGINKSVAELSRAEKAQLIYRKIVADSGDAIGDFKRTSDSFANTLVSLKSVAEDVQLALGQQMLKEIGPTVGEFGKFVKSEQGLRAMNKAVLVFRFVFGYVVNIVKTAVGYLKLFRTIGEAAFIIVRAQVQKLIEKFEPLNKAINRVSGVAKKAKDKLVDTFSGGGEKVDEFIDKVKNPELRKALEDIKTAGVDAAGTLSGTYEDMYNDLRRLLTENKELIIDGLDEEVNDTDDAASQILERRQLLANDIKAINQLTKAEQFMTDQEKLQSQIDALDMYLDEYQLSADQISRIDEARAKKQIELDALVLKERQANTQKAVGYAQDFSKSMGAIASGRVQIEKNRLEEIDEADTEARERQKDKIREAMEKEKKAKIAMALIDSAAAILKTMASVPFPLNIGLAGAQAAAGRIQVKTIKSTPLPSFARGVAELSSDVTANLHKGERILPASMNSPGVSNAHFANAAAQGLALARGDTYNQNTETNNQKYITLSGVTINTDSASDLLEQLEELAENTNTRLLSR